MAEHDEKPKAGPRYYRADANPDGAAIPGVPLADFTAAEFKALPLWVQRSIDAAPFYSATDPSQDAAPAGASTDPATPGLTPAPAGSSAVTMPGPQGVPAPTAGSNAVPAPVLAPVPGKES